MGSRKSTPTPSRPITNIVEQKNLDNNQQLGKLARGHASPPRPDEAQEAAGGPEEEGEYDQGDGLAAEAEEGGREVEVDGKVPPLVELQDSRVHNRWNLIPNLLQKYLPDCKYS